MQCKPCQFSCEKRGDWNRHILTKKHKNKTEDLQRTIELQKEQIRQQQEQLSQITTPIHITIILEQYKDAMNWEEFISTLELMSPNIMSFMLEKIKELGLYRRPIHCIQKQLCIKQENKWELDTRSRAILNDTTNGLRRKYVLQWEQKHPEWYQSEQETNEYTSFFLEMEPMDVSSITV
jgi:hypothetical protein